MKKQKRFILYLVALLFLVFVPQKTVKAAENTLNDLSIHVQLNEDGSARIIEERRVNLKEGTENYIVIGNLGNSDIKDFVVEENGQQYEFVSDWDLDWSRQEKAFKNGIISKSNGYELSWGIGEYGDHTYTVSYTVTDFIKQTEDEKQILFWRFLNDKTDIPPKQVSVTIEGDIPFSSEDEKIWAYGYEGRIEFEEGKIHAQSDSSLSKSDYVTILAQFPEGTFRTGPALDETFEEIKANADKGSDYGSEKGLGGGKGVVGSVFSFIVKNIVFLIAPIAVLFSFISTIFKLGSKKGRFKRKFKEEYYRDLPYDGPVSDVYYILYTMRVTDFEELLTGYLLKWIYEERLEATQVETGKFFKKEETQMTIQKGPAMEDDLEKQLFSMVIAAAGDDHILEGKEFNKWAANNITKIEQWKKDMQHHSLMKLQEYGYVTVKKKKVLLFFNKDTHVLTPKGEEMEENIYKFINYLHDFSLMNEHQSINVKLWDKLMIWAGYFGITEQVMEEFKKIYPNYEIESAYHGGAIYYTNTMSRSVSQSAVRSSGGGGSSSSGGGGGGSFGGGSGGGTR